MFQIVLKGKTLIELKKALEDFNNKFNIHTDVESTPVVAPVATPVVTPVAGPVTTPVISDDNLDAEGLPWDKRINSSGKTKDKKGFWIKKRKIEDSLVQEVKKELREALYFQQNPPVVPPAPVTTPVATPVTTPAPVVAPVTTPVAPPVVPPAPVTTPAPVVTPVAAPVTTPVAAPVVIPQPMTAGGHTVETFIENFSLIMANLITEGKIDQEYVNSLQAHFGVSQMWEVTDEQKAELFESFSSPEFNLIQKV